jgi:hypothetical protein
MVYGPVALALLWLGTRARSAGLPAAAPRRPYLMGASVLTALVVLGLALAPGPVDLTTWYAPLRWIGLPGAGRVLWTGLGLALVGAAWSLGRRSRTEGESQWVAMVVILVPTALAHNLSTMYLRWTYDNNPIIVLAMAWVAREAVAIVQRLGTPVRAVAHAALGIVMQLGAWMSLAPQLAVARQCTEPWPEVAHLRGARLRPTAGGMRELVRIVRELTAPGDSVLLLPEDPNVGAWLERPRPHLTSAIAFADQYWDRYVDEDVRRLSAAPPRVIVVGPRGIAPVFARLFGNRYWGVERLADRVARELLPRAYVLHVQQVIAFQRGTDRMDVYVRRDTP